MNIYLKEKVILAVSFLFLGLNGIVLAQIEAVCTINGKEVPCKEALPMIKKMLLFMQELIALFLKFVEAMI